MVYCIENFFSYITSVNFYKWNFVIYMKRIYKEEHINIDVSTIFNLINDIEKYPNYLPWCTKTEVEKPSNNTVIGKIYISKSFINGIFLQKII